MLASMLTPALTGRGYLYYIPASVYVKHCHNPQFLTGLAGR